MCEGVTTEPAVQTTWPLEICPFSKQHGQRDPINRVLRKEEQFSISGSDRNDAPASLHVPQIADTGFGCRRINLRA